MGMELKGFDALINDLNNLGNVGNKIGRKAVEEGSKIVLEQQKKDAPRSGDDDHGADKLDITEIKKYTKSGTVVGRVGISSDNWEDTKGLMYSSFKTPLIRWNPFTKGQYRAKPRNRKV